MLFERSGIKAMDQQVTFFRCPWLTMWGSLLIMMIMVAATAVTSAQTQDRPPNILFILVDDLGWGDLARWHNPPCVPANPGPLVPYLDSLACQGTRFNGFYANWPDCPLSRVAFMTGRFPARYRDAYLRPDKGYGIPDWLDPDVPTIAALLKKAGYVTAHFGKWYLEDYSPWLPEITEYGFDKGVVTYEQEDPYWRTNSTERIVDDAIQFIEANPGKPFYINLWTYLVHSPLRP